MTLKDRRRMKRELISALQLRGAELRSLYGTRAYAPSSGRNADVRRFEDAMNERRVAEREEVPPSTLSLGRARYTLFATPSAHESLAKELNRLSASRFDRWSLEPKVLIDTSEW